MNTTIKIKTKSTGMVIPHHTPSHVYHLAQLSAYRDLLAKIKLDETASKESVLSYLDSILSDLSEVAWLNYCKAALPPGFAEKNLRKPSSIRFDPAEGVPVTIWNEENPELTDAWGMFIVSPENSETIAPLTLISPFQPLAKESLPDSTLYIELTDSSHSALATLFEILSAQLKDVARLANNHTPNMAWRQMQVLRSWYSSIASTSMEYLPRDHLRDWSDHEVPYTNLNNGQIYVTRHGLTVLAQKALSLKILTQHFTSQLNAVDEQYGLEPEHAVNVFLRSMQSDVDALAVQMSATNDNRLLSSGFVPDRYQSFVAFADNTRDLPYLVAVPKDKYKPHQIEFIK